MANVIKPKKTEVGGRVPTTADIAVGELAWNVEDKKIYTRKSDDTIVLMGGDSAGMYLETSGGQLTGSLLINNGDLTANGNAAIGGGSLNTVSLSGTVDVVNNLTIGSNATVNGFNITDIEGITNIGVSGQRLSSAGDGTYYWETPSDSIYIEAGNAASVYELPENKIDGGAA